MCNFDGCAGSGDVMPMTAHGIYSILGAILIVGLTMWFIHIFGDQIESALKAFYKRIPIFDLWS